MNNRVVHFEIQVDDIERAKKFYTDVFGWGWQDWSGVTGEPYWGILTAPMEADGTPSKEAGINGGLLKRHGSGPAGGAAVNAFVCTIMVEDIEDTMTKINSSGGMIVVPKTNLGDMAWQAYAKDTEGNILGLHQLISKK
jgi:predicted enzyme related to lactoylglutathione lyase